MLKKVPWFWLLELMLVLLIATLTLQLWGINFGVPFSYEGDTLWFLMSVKGMIDNGWTYDIPQLSAPFSLSMAAFPSITNLDWGIMKVISLFIADAGVVLNIFWIFSIVLTAWSATLALRLLDIEKWLALGLGLIYSFLPFALWRNTGHISLVFYCVPLLSLFAIHLARADEHPHENAVRIIGYFAAVAQGLNYIYYSFFALLLFFFGGLLGFRNKRSWKPICDAAMASGVLILISAINLMPSYISWQEHGKLPSMDFKAPQEAEVFGLKLRQMLVPHRDNIIPPFSTWAKRDHSIPFPNENENYSARLGPFAALGFLFLLAVSLGLVRSNKNQEINIIKSIASLTLFSFFITTVGGFGAIINQIIGPDIRCYNRFSVFIAFLSITGLGIWLQTCLKTAPSNRSRLLVLSGTVLLLSFSFYDQLLDASYLNKRRPGDEQSAYYEKRFVEKLEENLPPGTLVFQLPITWFPGGSKERNISYDHTRPYLWSKQLHWSWPTLSQQHQNWQKPLEDLNGEALAEALILSKFRVVWVDRSGYWDNGTRIISSLIAAGASDMLPGVHPRYVALDLEPIAKGLRQRLGVSEFAQRQAALLNTPGIIEWISGIYPEEYDRSSGRRSRWSQAESMIQIRNPTDISKSAILSFLIGSGRQGNLTISTETEQIVVPVTTQEKPVELPLVLEPHSTKKVQFKCDTCKMLPPLGETRDLHFYLTNLSLRIAPATTQSSVRANSNF